MFVPVFELKKLKRYFYYFLATSVLIALISVVVLEFTKDGNPRQILQQVNSWLLLFALLIGNILFDISSRRELTQILETSIVEEKFNRYENHFKKRLLWNALSFAFTGVFLILTQQDLFLYILIIQVFLTAFFYPRKSIISKELMNEDIVFI